MESSKLRCAQCNQTGPATECSAGTQHLLSEVREAREALEHSICSQIEKANLLTSCAFGTPGVSEAAFWSHTHCFFHSKEHYYPPPEEGDCTALNIVKWLWFSETGEIWNLLFQNRYLVEHKYPSLHWKPAAYQTSISKLPCFFCSVCLSVCHCFCPSISMAL